MAALLGIEELGRQTERRPSPMEQTPPGPARTREEVGAKKSGGRCKFLSSDTIVIYYSYWLPFTASQLIQHDPFIIMTNLFIILEV